ncbi:hypothetical protein [Tsukamurella paurometabola]|uniref:Uncharacterized protein n=1 Tax=Tsukamurella paurometabola TaxID=2061 RepID=A0A3P8K176_TSUPA|nr:hypothetical protein [Tsukamurella paurometabola]UEA81790.1 hypothetical protein LK411_15530 [Tsukamurella paurometabola]VDR38804.1 Uncharacterised protein [Tsukamurella paurometabola]
MDHLPDLCFAAVPHVERSRLLVVSTFVDDPAGEVFVALADRSADPHDASDHVVSLRAADALTVADGIRSAVTEVTAIVAARRRRSA